MKKEKRLKKFNISNKLGYTLMVILSIALLGIGVWAAAPNPGHSANQIGDWPACGSGQVLGVVSGALTCVTPSATDSRFSITTNGLCYYNSAGTCALQTTTCYDQSFTVASPWGDCSTISQSQMNSYCHSLCTSATSGYSCNGDTTSQCNTGTTIYPTSYTGECIRLYNQISCNCDFPSGTYKKEIYTAAGTRCI